MDCKDCKVFSGEACTTQHRLLVMDICMKRVIQDNREVTPKILWKNLKGDKVGFYKERIELARDRFYDEDVNRMWNRLACTIRNVATDMLGVTSRKVQVQKEAWWWDQEVQERVKIKHDHFRELLCCQDDEQVDMRRILYKEDRRTAKKTVAEAKSKAYEAMYNHLGSKEGQMVFLDWRRWHNYFRELFNEERIGVREIGADSESSFDFSVQPSMSGAEVKGSLHKMGRGKATGPDQIPIEVWLCLGEEGEQWLTRLFDSILRTSDIPQEWRLSMVVPIYKNKGDAQDCSNYRGIKLLSHTKKLLERVIETRLRSKVEVSENQFGFMSGRSTLEAIHLLRKLMVKYHVHSKDLHLVFIDLEKAYDSVPREVIWESLVAKGMTWIYLRVIQEMYFQSDGGILESNGLRVSRSKMEYLWCNFSNQPNDEGVDVLLGDQVLPPKDNFRNKLRVAPIAEKVREGRLRWFGHIRRRRVVAPVRRVEDLVVSGSRRRWRPRKTWTDLLTLDLRALNLNDDMTSDQRS
ncbi:uncharacterized protein LOC141665877 [Apium graveolens]|uniref:uncharacterized protein LOC141665877 n=1 Tax=Apium graveolens TaxID=4045 RepID=UPI003D79ED26